LTIIGAENSRCKYYNRNPPENYSLILIISLESMIKMLLNSISVPFFLISVGSFPIFFFSSGYAHCLQNMLSESFIERIAQVSSLFYETFITLYCELSLIRISISFVSFQKSQPDS
jgi:hypothetical protein